MISKQQGVSIFFPCYNDAKSIKSLVENAFSTIKRFTTKYEVIVIDDCSYDSSRKVLQRLAKKYRRLKLIFHDKNYGYGGALRSGFKKAKYELIFYTDGDGQYDVKELPVLLYLMNKDVDFINGIKMSRHDPTYRIVIGNIYSLLIRWLFWVPIIDVDCDFRLIRKSLLDKFDLKSNSGSICIELIKKSQITGAKFRQVSVRHLERRDGVSQFFRVERILQTFKEVSILWVKLMVLRNLIRLLKTRGLQFILPASYNPIHAVQKQAR